MVLTPLSLLKVLSKDAVPVNALCTFCGDLDIHLHQFTGLLELLSRAGFTCSGSCKVPLSVPVPHLCPLRLVEPFLVL